MRRPNGIEIAAEAAQQVDVLKTIVALARKLLIALARYVSHGEIPTGAIVKAD